MEKQNGALKQWMRRYQELQVDADRLSDRAADLRGRIQSARTAGIDGLPHSQSRDGDRIGSDLARLEELEMEAAEAQQEATAARREIEAAIRSIVGPRWADRREVLRLRYLDGLRWEDVSERLYGDEADYWDRPEAFLRRVYKLHGAALEELSKIVPLEPGQEMTNEEEKGNERNKESRKASQAGPPSGPVDPQGSDNGSILHGQRKA